MDYHKLNAIIRKDAYLIPRINKLLAYSYKAKIFTKLNIRAAFNKIYINPNFKEYTTFHTHYRTYKTKVLLFSLCNSLAIY